MIDAAALTNLIVSLSLFNFMALNYNSFSEADLFLASDYADLCEHAAEQIAGLVRAKPNAVLGLATGSTPLGVYEALVRRYQAGGLDFADVTCFNLDEYYPMLAEASQSYHQFMQRHLFGQINCRRWFVPEGRLRSRKEITQGCLDYEAQIVAAGGIDLQLLGIGRTGHIGFNEPGSDPASRTRLVALHSVTRQDAAPAFGSLVQVPAEAITMGIGTILEAKKIVLLASGRSKAEILHTLWTQEPAVTLPASWLRIHPNLALCLDTDAASLLP